jgi:uncharacterized protein YodC (DUF2158 family)
MNTFKPGDIVRLKSGGLKMTVSEIVGKENDVTVICLWTEYGDMFDGVRPETIQERGFKPHVIVKVEDGQ